MKKKFVAMLMSITMCLTMVGQAGAAVFEDADAAEGAAAAVLDVDAGAPAADMFETQAGVQEAEIPNTPAAASENVFQDAPEDVIIITPVPEEQEAPSQDTEIFSSEEEAVSTEAPDESAEEVPADHALLEAADGKIFLAYWRYDTAKKKWKLRKPVTVSAALLNASGEQETEEISEEPVFGEAGIAEVTEIEPMTADAFESVEISETLFSSASDEMTAEEAPETEAESVPAEETAPEAVSAEEQLLQAVPEEYYTAEDGVVHIRVYQSVSSDKIVTEGDYLFDAEGYLITGAYEVPAGTKGSPVSAADAEFFFMNQENAVPFVSGSTAERSPANSNMGQLQKDYWYWTGKLFRYYAKDTGAYTTVRQLMAAAQKAGTFTGVYTINGEKYVLSSSGTPRVGDVRVTINGVKNYYYGLPATESGQIPGRLFHSGWMKTIQSNGLERWRKYDDNGLFIDQGGNYVTKLDKNVDPNVGSYTYFLSRSGYILKSRMTKAADGYIYATDAKGRIYKDKVVKYQGYRYYMDKYGRRSRWRNCWKRLSCAGNRYYYFGAVRGRIEEQSGWKRIVLTNGTVEGWYYFPASGNHYKNVLLKSGRFILESGALYSGIGYVNGKTYFFAGSGADAPGGVMYKSTWIHFMDKWYYAGSDGALYQNGWGYIDGGYYYFNSDFTVLTNQPVTKDGVAGYVDSRGTFCKAGWLVVSSANNLVKYIDPATGPVVNTSKVINGQRFYFDANGYRINDVSNIVGGPYYLEVDRVNGVINVYNNSSKSIPVKSVRCSVGLPGTPTWPTNRTLVLTRALRWQPLMGPSWGQYATHIDGAGNGGIYIHSVAGGTRSYYNLPAGEYNKLGSPASHGCVRVCVADARWIYYNCNNSTVKIIDGAYVSDEAFKGPLGRPARVPLYGSCNFDPTDNLAWH